MIDVTTHKPLRVLNYGGDESTIIAPIELLERVRGVLDASGITYWIDDETLTVNDEPEVAFIDFSNHKNDPAKVQHLLDSVS